MKKALRRVMSGPYPPRSASSIAPNLHLKTSRPLAYESRMRNSLVATLSLGLAILAGCGPNQAAQELIAQQSAPYRERGNATIAGRAFLIAPDGRQIPAGSEEIYLTPVTSWAESRVPQVVESNKIPSGSDRAAQVWWTTRADASGGFSFEGLAPGEYFVLTSIAFNAGGQAVERVAYARVMLAPGQVADVQVTRQL